MVTQSDSRKTTQKGFQIDRAREAEALVLEYLRSLSEEELIALHQRMKSSVNPSRKKIEAQGGASLSRKLDKPEEHLITGLLCCAYGVPTLSGKSNKAERSPGIRTSNEHPEKAIKRPGTQADYRIPARTD